jgi:hypothetical protein
MIFGRDKGEEALDLINPALCSTRSAISVLAVGGRSMLRGPAAANIQPLLLGGYPYMVVVALPFRVTAEVPGEIEDPVAGEFVLCKAHSVPARSAWAKCSCRCVIA